MQVAALRIKNLHFPADHVCLIDHRLPVHTADQLAQLLPVGIGCIQPKKPARRTVEKGDPAVIAQQYHSFAQGLEDLDKKSLFLQQAVDKRLHDLGIDPIEL